ncbi:MAG: serine hydrolase [Streptosporangiales bacterium]
MDQSADGTLSPDRPASPSGTIAEVTATLSAVDAHGWVHAVDLDSGAEFAYDADQPVVLASVFKIPVLIELFRQFGDGRLDSTARRELPVEGRSDGPTGLSAMADPIELSLRDLAYWMMSVSDNAATDILVKVLGVEEINATVRALGLTRTRVDGTCDDLFQTMDADVPGLRGGDWDAESLRAARAVDPERTLHAGTAVEITRLLSMIWSDTAADPAGCAEMRRILRLQAWPHRLRSGFPERDAVVAGKTGTLPFWRNEVGVVEDEVGGRYAVAVFLRTSVHAYRNPSADACIGTLARLAVDDLRAAGGRRTETPRRPTFRPSTGDVGRAIRDRAEAAGARIWLHARDIDGNAAVGIDDSDPVVTASVFKVPVALELACQATSGKIDLTERVTVGDDDRVASPFGLAAHRDPVRMSYRDLALLMMVISDNVATDLVVDRVGKDRIAALLGRLGFAATAVPQNCREILDSISQDLGFSYGDDEAVLAELSAERLGTLRALSPDETCRTTAAEVARLLASVWRDEAAAANACALVRGWMANQIWPHRLMSGFPGDGITVSGKTGTLPLVRNEVGVVEYPDGGRYAIGVFTRAHSPEPEAPEIDALIGWAAAEAVAHLRGERDG